MYNDELITKEQMAVIFANYIKIKNFSFKKQICRNLKILEKKANGFGFSLI